VNPDHPVLHFAATSQPLSRRADGVMAALGGSRFINAANRLGVGVIVGDDSLAAVAKTGLVPMDRFQQTLKRSRLRVKSQGNGFDGLSSQIRKQSPNVDASQSEPRSRSKTIAKEPKEGIEFLADPSHLR
jgi:hypothetical protein